VVQAVIPNTFEYVAPKTALEATGLLQQYGGEGKLLAGGQSLIPLMKFRLASPAYLIDLQNIPELTTLEERDDGLVMGAMVRESALESSAMIRQRYRGIAETSAVVADPLVRNFATIGGNLAHADPANDHPAMMLATRATVIVSGPTGQRAIPIDDFLVDTFQTALDPDEILLEIHVPRALAHTGSAYTKFERKVGDYAIAAVAAQLTLDGDTCTSAGIALTNVGPKAIRATAAEQFLIGKQMSDEEVVREAARLAAQAAEPAADLRGPAEYKRHVVRTLTARTLRTAAQRAHSA